MVLYESQLSHGEKLNCKFKDEDIYPVGNLYSCNVRSFVNQHDNITIEGYSGVHETNKNDNDVKAIQIFITEAKYIPANLGFLSNLTAFGMFITDLIEIKAKDFQGMQNLEDLSLFMNDLRSLPSDAFASLTKLRMISLGWNKIEELPIGLFSNNVNLKSIGLDNNKIKFLGSGLFDTLTKLYHVNLEVNICVSKDYDGATAITQMKEDIKLYCKNPNEVPASTTLNNL